ncbi:putative RNA-directed DNA polymerase from transposon X-element [Trichonephila clavipes]|nr:putative RNA-directed DNA polymerase from transposon X-element [Trichonephila clavipes]
MAVVIPILKPNSDDSNPQNYRPISLLSSLSKAYEFVILNRLNQHCLAKNIIPEQHGFVTKCSTVTQLLRVTELVHTGFQNHQATDLPDILEGMKSSNSRIFVYTNFVLCSRSRVARIPVPYQRELVGLDGSDFVFLLFGHREEAKWLNELAC